MSAMSVSPVKLPPSSSANNGVSPAATNLTKPAVAPPMPTGHGYTLNLVPEVKQALNSAAITPEIKPAVNSAVITPEKSCSVSAPSVSIPSVTSPLVLPTSNGSVSAEPAQVPASSFENCKKPLLDHAENLSTSISGKANEGIIKATIVTTQNAVKDIPDHTSLVQTEPTPLTVKCAEQHIGKKTEKLFPPPADKVFKNDEKNKIEPALGNKNIITPEKSSNTADVICSKMKSHATAIEKKKDDPKTDSEVKFETIPESPVDEAPVVTQASETIGTKKSPIKTVKRKIKDAQKPLAISKAEDDGDGGRPKRTRLPTQPFQCPTPELNKIMNNLATPTKSPLKPTTDKITVFYKNEFLAVRNPEGSFYICQTFQNIFRGSTKIKIRWFTNLPQNIYTPDFYDTTELDCILTNVTMTRVEKDRWKLPDNEHTRVENILKRALDVEQGVANQVDVTEEHPDGLDLSLYKDEAQLQVKRKKKTPPAKKTETVKESLRKKKKKTKAEKKSAKCAKPVISPPALSLKKSRTSTYLSRDSIPSGKKVEAKPNPVKSSSNVEKTGKTGKKDKKKQKKVGAKKQSANVNSSKSWEPSVRASNSSKVVLSLKKSQITASEIKPTPTKRTSSVSLKAASANTSPAPAARRRKEEPQPIPNPSPIRERAGKVRSAGSAVAAKITSASASMRTTKEKNRKASPGSSQR